MRGKVEPENDVSFPLRITPACAGKSLCRFLRFLSVQDHPRVCGEKLKQHKLVSQVKGSPPRVRGKEMEWHHIPE